MTKNKNNQAIWNTRIRGKSSTFFQKVGSSLNIDKRLYKEDIKGSIVHIEMLFKQKIDRHPADVDGVSCRGVRSPGCSRKDCWRAGHKCQ